MATSCRCPLFFGYVIAKKMTLTSYRQLLLFGFVVLVLLQGRR